MNTADFNLEVYQVTPEDWPTFSRNAKEEFAELKATWKRQGKLLINRIVPVLDVLIPATTTAPLFALC